MFPSGNQIFRIAADGTGTSEKLLEVDRAFETYGASPDGKFLVCFEDKVNNKNGNSTDIMVLPLDGHGQPRPLIQTDSRNLNAEISPDGRWMNFTVRRAQGR